MSCSTRFTGPCVGNRSNTAMDCVAISPIFVSHGSPTTALEPGAAGEFMRRLGPAIDAVFGPPKAIVAPSAHTLEPAPVLLAAARHDAVHDFAGFDDAPYGLRYDACGAAARATEAAEPLRAAGIEAATLPRGGLDHGMWTPLRYMWPAADVQVLPLAWVPDGQPRRLFEFGAALAPLARRGVLILGTGSITHNLRRAFAGAPRGSAESAEIPQSAAFRAWWHARCQARDWDALFDYRRAAPHAVDMHPGDEHLLPWFVTAGAGGTAAAPLRLHAGVTCGCLGMDGYAFGRTAERLGNALRPAGASS
jgi:4,5-DOPA dioxygenase extradiol